MPKTNIVFILTDDQGPWAMRCAGNPEIRTPHLDRLASSGLRFDSFFCASPVCSPARASILTGRMPSQHGIHDWLSAGNAAVEADHPIQYLEGQLAYTDILSQHGYDCGFCGKWHVGDSAQPQKGFNHWRVHVRGGGPYYGAPMIWEGKDYREPKYITDAITDDALECLVRFAKGDRPFYLSVHYTAPHSPWDRDNHPKRVYDSYKDCPFLSCPDVPAHPWQINSAPRGTGEARRQILQGYFAAVTCMDANVGRILDKLEDLGIREDTLVIFMSDNGMNMGHHGVYGKGNGTFPMNMYDTSVKVPCLMSRPGHVPVGVIKDHLLSQVDILPTLPDYLGVRAPDLSHLPGKSFAPLLRGKSMPESEHVVVCDEYGPVRMIRDKEWKYVHRYPYGPNELFDLKNDPDETQNLIQEPKHRALVEKMRDQLTRWFLRYVDPALDGSKESVTGKGQLEQVGPKGQGRRAFEADWHYIDAEGQRRA